MINDLIASRLLIALYASWIWSKSKLLVNTLPGLILPSRAAYNKTSLSGLVTEAIPPRKPTFFQNNWFDLGSACGTPTLPIVSLTYTDSLN